MSAMDKDQSGPNRMAADMDALIPNLVAQRDATKDKRERAELNSRLKAARMLSRFAKTRAGYVA